MKYEYGLVNYFLHELGNNLNDGDSALINENKLFDSELSEKDRIIKEIDKIKDKSCKYSDYLDADDENIREIIVCIDLLLKIEISFKTSFIKVATELLKHEDFNIMIDNTTNSYDETIEEADKLLISLINNYLVKLCT